MEDSEKSEGLREESAAYEMEEDEEERVQGKDVSVDLRLKNREVPLSKPGLQIKEENQVAAYLSPFLQNHITWRQPNIW